MRVLSHCAVDVLKHDFSVSSIIACTEAHELSTIPHVVACNFSASLQEQQRLEGKHLCFAVPECLFKNNTKSGTVCLRKEDGMPVAYSASSCCFTTSGIKLVERLHSNTSFQSTIAAEQVDSLFQLYHDELLELERIPY